MEFALCYSLQFTVENESAFALVLRVRLVTLMFSKTGTPKKTKAFSVIYKRLHEMIPSTVKEVSK